MILCATATAFWLRCTGRFIPASPNFLVRATVALCVFFFDPFSGPLLSIGRSWTGLELGEEDQRRINVFLVQMASWKVPAIHETLGPFLMFLVSPCILAALFCNSSENLSSRQEHGIDAGPVWKTCDASSPGCRLARIYRGSVASCAVASRVRFLATCSLRKAAGHPAPHVSQSASICSHGFSGRRQILDPDPVRLLRLPAIS